MQLNDSHHQYLISIQGMDRKHKIGQVYVQVVIWTVQGLPQCVTQTQGPRPLHGRD